MVLNSKNDSPSKLEVSIKAMISGLENGLPGRMQKLALGGQKLDVSEVISEFNTWLDDEDTVRDLEGKKATAVAKRNAGTPGVRTRLRQLKAQLPQILGETNQELKKFGLKPKAPPQELSAEEKAAKVAKARATRAAHKKANSQGSNATPPNKNVA